MVFTILRAFTARSDNSSSRSKDRHDPRSIAPPARSRIEASFPSDPSTGEAPPRSNMEPRLSLYESSPPTEYRLQPPDLPFKMEKKERYTFRPAAHLEKNAPIRPIFLLHHLHDRPKGPHSSPTLSCDISLAKAVPRCKPFLDKSRLH